MKQTIFSKAGQVAILLVCILASFALSSCGNNGKNAQSSIGTSAQTAETSELQQEEDPTAVAWETLKKSMDKEENYPMVINNDALPDFQCSLIGESCNPSQNEFKFILRAEGLPYSDLQDAAIATKLIDMLHNEDVSVSNATGELLDAFFNEISEDFFKRVKAHETFRKNIVKTGCNVVIEWRTSDGVFLGNKVRKASYFR